jgi:hypothetical protein
MTKEHIKLFDKIGFVWWWYANYSSSHGELPWQKPSSGILSPISLEVIPLGTNRFGAKGDP